MAQETKPKVEMRGCTPLSDEEFFKLYYSTERKSEMSLNKSKPGEFFYDRAKEYLKAWGNFTDEQVETYPWSLVDVITIMQEFNICDVQVSLDAGKDEAADFFFKNPDFRSLRNSRKIRNVKLPHLCTLSLSHPRRVSRYPKISAWPVATFYLVP